MGHDPRKEKGKHTLKFPRDLSWTQGHWAKDQPDQIVSSLLRLQLGLGFRYIFGFCMYVLFHSI